MTGTELVFRLDIGWLGIQVEVVTLLPELWILFPSKATAALRMFATATAATPFAAAATTTLLLPLSDAATPAPFLSTASSTSSL